MKKFTKLFFITVCMLFAFSSISFAATVGVYETADGAHTIEVKEDNTISYDNTYSLTLTNLDTGDKLSGKIGTDKQAVTFYELNDSTWVSYTTVKYTHNSVTTYLYEYTTFHLDDFKPILKEDGIYEVWSGDTRVNSYADLQSAVSAAESGETVKILVGGKVNAGVYVADKVITIDGCNQTLDKSEWTNSVFVVEKDATLNLKNISIDGGADGFEVDYDAVSGSTIPLKANSADGDFLSNVAAVISKGNFNADTVDISNNFIAKNGAGVYLANGTANLKNSIFNHNRASKGAAIYIGSEFEANQTEYSVKNVIIDNCEFEKNYAAHGAGVFIIHTENVEFYNTDFISNTLTGNGYGAAIMVSYNSHKKNGVTYNSSGHANGLDYTQVKVDNCLFEGNWVGNDGYAIQNFDAEFEITNSTFKKNKGVSSSSVATISLYVMREDEWAEQIIDNCVLEENEGHVSCIGDHGTRLTTKVYNTEFIGNKGRTTAYYLTGCALYENCTFKDEEVSIAVILNEPCDTSEWYEGSGFDTSHIEIKNVKLESASDDVIGIFARTYQDKYTSYYVKADVVFEGNNYINVYIKDNNVVTLNGNQFENITIDYKTETSKLVISDNANMYGKIINNTLNVKYPSGDVEETKQIPAEEGIKASSYYIQELLGVEKEGYVLRLYTNADFSTEWDYNVAKGIDLYGKWEEHTHVLSDELSIEQNRIVKACECGYFEECLKMEEPDDLMFDGNEKRVIIINTLEIPETDYVVVYKIKTDEGWEDIEVPVNAGTYKAILTLNETLVIEKSYTITRLFTEEALGDLNQTLGNIPEFTHPAISQVTDGTVKVEYKLPGSGDDEYTETLPTTEGEYIVKVTITGDSNIVDTTLDGNLTINPKPVDPKPVKPSSGGSSVPRYKITVAYEEGGEISPNTASVKRGNDKTFKIQVYEGYKIIDVLIDGESVGAITSYTFENVKEKHTIEAVFEKLEVLEKEEWKNPYEDVFEEEWYYDSVKFVDENGIMNGMGAGKFEPFVKTTRGMIVTILYRLEKEPAVNKSIPFADVDMSKYYGNAIIWAKQNNIVKGIDENTFMPEAEITREQLVTILYRYAKYIGHDVSIGENTNILSYDDFAEVSEYAIEAFQWSCGSGLVQGRTESTLNPKDKAMRSEIATVIMRFIK